MHVKKKKDEEFLQKNAKRFGGMKKNCKTAEEIYTAAEPIILSGLWTKNEITSAMNEIERQLTHHKITNPYYEKAFEDIDIIRTLASQNVEFRTIKEEIEKEINKILNIAEKSYDSFY